MIKSLEESGEKITQLSSSVSSFKDIIHVSKEAITSAQKSINMLENKCRQLEDVISAKDRKIINLVDQILSYTKYSDVNIEPDTYSGINERDLWAKRCRDSECDLGIRKK